MKQKILTALQTKYPGVDEKTLDRIATKLAKTVTKDEDIQTAVDGVSVQQLMENYGDTRATEATVTAVKNYEKKHGLKDGKPIVDETTPPAEPPVEEKPAEQIPSYMREYMEKQKALEAKLAAYEAEKLGGSRKNKLAELLKDAPENVRKMYLDNFANMTFKDDEAFDGWLESNKATIEGLTKDFAAAGASVRPPKGGTGNPNKPQLAADVKAALDASIKSQSSSAAPIIAGMPTAPK